ncbi:SCO family protein [Mariniflexile sp. AS56]|uniref:SCO family protein n=1 Tax=Mariniflexile sp. AS56 TaxID=3063957 RepID=UPI0026F10E40|nr:SCO family protein [Mariniflexile sp. AS56]MDO7174167.1 SCO family protein [Mariniflexile sp. AS56]
MYRIVFLLLSSLSLLGCKEQVSSTVGLPYYNEPTFTPVFIKDTGEVTQKITHTISNFEFLNQDSVLVNQSFIENKIHVANFIFTSCGSICPTMTNHMKQVADSLKTDERVVFLSYSVTPWLDTPSVLKNYQEREGVTNKNWQFLTGSKGDIYKLARQSYFAEEDLGFSKDSTEFLHTEHFILVDKTKRIRGIYNGTLALEMNALLEDIRTLQAE